MILQAVLLFQLTGQSGPTFVRPEDIMAIYVPVCISIGCGNYTTAVVTKSGTFYVSEKPEEIAKKLETQTVK